MRPRLAVAAILLGAFLSPLAARAQITNVTDATSTPIPGAGHDYIQLLGETVNPANGSVNISIPLPIPKGRGLTLPISYTYSSNGVFLLYPETYLLPTWIANTGQLYAGGWNFALPQLTSAQGQIGSPSGYGGVCNYLQGFTLQDAANVRKNLYINAITDSSDDTLCGTSRLTYSVDGINAQLGGGFINGNPTLPLQAAITDPDGNLYYFSQVIGSSPGSGSGNPQTPNYMEDRNGNVLTINQNTSTTAVDTLGRTVFSYASSAVTLSGLSYQTTSTSATPNYAIPATLVTNFSNIGCPWATGTINTPITVTNSITLPNNQSYQFYYGNNPNPSFQNPYGLLSEVDYPSGMWVRYTWKLSDQMSDMAVLDGYNLSTNADAPQMCAWQYQVPVVATRSVGFSGSSNPILTQTFTYATTWNGSIPNDEDLGTGTAWTQKTTTVVTTDDIRNTSFTTVYSYVPYFDYPLGESWSTDTPIPNEIPVESQIQYYNVGGTSPIRTETKTWVDPYLLATDDVTLDSGQTSQTVNTYNSNGQLTEKQEYDYGQTTPTRTTIIKYQTFNPAPVPFSNSPSTFMPSILDKPCQEIVEDENGNSLSETDTYYDNAPTTQVCGPPGTPSVQSVANLPTGTHDGTCYGPTPTGGCLVSAVSRGNATTVIKKCLQSAPACAGGDSVTTYTYDETGQVLSATDACGNGSCSDMPSSGNHTTTYSYTDNYSSCGGNAPPSGSTNAYLTTLTYPSTGVAHVENFCYGYDDGQLRSSSDQNGKTTSYVYSDPLRRITAINYPDEGQTTYSYNDAPPNPTVTTTKLATPDPSVTSVATMDGMGHVIQTALTSDPISPVYTASTYDGMGRLYQSYNPTRCTPPTNGGCAEPTWGATTYAYDSLGRTTSVIEPDNSVVTTAYSGNSTTVTDEAGNSRETLTDGLGRLTEVVEPNSSSPATPGTGSATTAGTEQSVNLSGSPGTGTVTISGSDKEFEGIYDSGTVSVTVNGTQVQTYYSQSTTNYSIAYTLASLINSDITTVTASANGYGEITITAKSNGASTDYTLSASSATTSYDYEYFEPTSFPVEASGSTLTGGENAGTNYDTGTVTVEVNGSQKSVSYGQTSTAQSVATALASALSASGSPVTASASGTTISLTATTTGSSSNYSLLAWSNSSQPSLFSEPSFTITASGSALTGGAAAGQIGSASLETMYTYDALDNLLQVQQQGGTTNTAQWRTRTFTYDGLSRLATSINPESNTVPCATAPCPTVATSYSYDANGNLASKTMPAQNQQSTATVTLYYCYDPLNRLTAKAYSSLSCGGNDVAMPPAVAIYGYDGISPPNCALTLSAANPIGRRTNMCDAAGSEAWSYDAMGRMAADERMPTGLTAATASYVYDLNGAMTSLAYPSGNVVNYVNNGAGQPVSAEDTAHGIDYATAATYAPQGALSSLQNGANIVSSLFYNDRLQPCRIAVNSSGSAPTSCTASNTGNVLDLAYNFHPGADNGNVMGITNNINSARSESFSYDSLNRISAAWTTSGNLWGETYDTDAWGNMNQFIQYSNLPLQEPSMPLTANDQNQISTFCYDTAGNVLAEAGSPCPPTQAAPGFTYNAENQLTFADGVNYVYDGDGNRVEKYMLNTQNQIVFQELYWYGGGSDPLDETDGTGSTTDSAFHEYVFFNGARTARRDSTSSGDVQYYFGDQLGSARVVTNATGTPQSDIDYCPYGGECYVASDTSGNNYKFTGKERDTESGLDNFSARYNASSIARFMSPDPANAGADPSDPQSWNMYNYVLNNPLNATDPSGLNCVWDDGSYDADDDPVTGTEDGCASQGGTWINQVTGDWNPNANSVLAAEVGDIENSEASPDAIVSAGDPDSYPPTSSQYIEAIGAEVAPYGALADCASDATISNFVPFGGTFMKWTGIKPNFGKATAADKAGEAGEATDMTGKVAQHSEYVARALNVAEMPNIAQVAAKYGPEVGKAVEDLALPLLLLNAYNAAKQGASCYSAAASASGHP